MALCRGRQRAASNFAANIMLAIAQRQSVLVYTRNEDFKMGVDLYDNSKWNNYFAWFEEKAIKFKETFRKYI